MRNILFILVVTFLAVAVLIFIVNPELLDKIWLWLIGFAGGIIGLLRGAYEWLVQLFRRKDNQEIVEAQRPEVSVSNAEIIKSQNVTAQKLDTLTRKIEEKPISALNTPFNGTTLTLLRYLDDGEATLGLLYFRNEFFSYVLEDTFHQEKIKGQTRIPAGEYAVDFNPVVTTLTQKYRNRFPWFSYHIQVKEVPNFDGIYIHIGNNSNDTEGCLLIADGINASSAQKTLISSTQAFERFYRKVKSLIDTGEKLRIVIHDENWFSKINLQNI